MMATRLRTPACQRRPNAYRSRGLGCLNNRHYDPTTGVFVSVDRLVTLTGEPHV